MKTNRKDAILAGDDFYDTGKPCKYGHYALRTTVAGSCVECAKAYKKNEIEAFKLAKNNKKEG